MTGTSEDSPMYELSCTLPRHEQDVCSTHYIVFGLRANVDIVGSCLVRY